MRCKRSLIMSLINSLIKLLFQVCKKKKAPQDFVRSLNRYHYMNSKLVKLMVPSEGTAEEVSLQWSHHQCLSSPGKQPILRHATIGFHREMTSTERTQKFYTDDVSLPRSGWCFRLVEEPFPRGMTNQKHYPSLSSDTSSVWNFCARSRRNFMGRKLQWHREMSAFFPEQIPDSKIKTAVYFFNKY